MLSEADKAKRTEAQRRRFAAARHHLARARESIGEACEELTAGVDDAEQNNAVTALHDLSVAARLAFARLDAIVERK